MNDRLIIGACAGTVAETLDRLEAELDTRGIPVFAVIDHAAGARGAGLELADEVVVIFGTPAVGTALMQADPTVGLDLPLRLLIWDDGGTRAAYRPPTDLGDLFDLHDAEPVLDRLTTLIAAIHRALTV